MAIYVNQNNQTTGPFDELSVEQAIRTGKLNINELACREGTSSWQPLNVFFPHIQGSGLLMARANGFRCPFCGSTNPPLIRQKISTAGWVWFIILFGSCIGTLFCWIGFLMKDKYRVCGSCGITLG